MAIDRLSGSSIQTNQQIHIKSSARAEAGSQICTGDSVQLSRKRSSGEAGTIPTLQDMQALCGSREETHSNAETQMRAQKLLSMKSAGTKEEVLVNNDRHIHVVIHGVPGTVNSCNHKGVTFRHYFASEEQKQAAMKSGALIAGPVAYAQVSCCYRADYPDLAGVFVTKPDVKPEQVGVPGRSVYVDLQFPADTGVLEIEPGKIYLVPSEYKRPDWIVDYYRKYKAGEEVPSYVLPSLQKIDQEGGLKEPTKVYFNEK